MAHWMEVPDLEAMLQEIDAAPASIETLCAAVAVIAETLDRPVKRVGGASPMATFEGVGLRFYNVDVAGDEYRVWFLHEAAQLDIVFGYTADLAWRICGYPCSPADMREARERALREGIEDLKRLPPQFFRPRRRSRQHNQGDQQD